METLKMHLTTTLIGTGAGFAWWCFIQLLLPTAGVLLPVVAGILAANAVILFKTS
jgi:hypothetical protein